MMPRSPEPLRALLSVALGLAFAAFFAGAPTLGADELDKARERLTRLEAARYEILPLSRGYGLRPLEERDFKLIEAIDGRVFVDGKGLEDEALAQRVGKDAARDLEALAEVATEARALEIEREIEESQVELERLREPVPDEPEAARPAPEASPAKPGTDKTSKSDKTSKADKSSKADKPSKRSSRRQGDPEPEAPVRLANQDDEVVFGGGLRLDSGETSPSVVVVGGWLEVAEGATVDGDVTVVGGSVRMAGRVRGSLVVVGGANTVTKTAVIDGDMVTVAARYERQRGAKVGGELVQVAVGDWLDLGSYLGAWRNHGPLFESKNDDGDTSFFGWLFRVFTVGLLFLLVCGCLGFAPERVRAISRRVRLQPFRSGLVGLLVQLLFLPLLAMACVVLLISIIGIPLLLIVPPLLILGFLLFCLLGYSGVALAAGRIAEDRFSFSSRSRFALAFFGMLLIEGWSLLGATVAGIGGPIRLTALLLLLFGFFLKYLVWTAGLGATVLERFRERLGERPLDSAELDSGALDSGALASPLSRAP